MKSTARLLAPFLLLAAAGLAADRAEAQGGQQGLPPGVRDLPIGLTPEEESLLGQIGMSATFTDAPSGPVRAAAEWDENIGVFCLWNNATLIKELQTDNDVYIITQNSSWWLSWLTSNSIPHTNIKFLNAPTDTFWVRDYGPWFIWDGNDDFGITDTVYNRPRPKDDVIPLKISQAYGIAHHGVDLTHTGGNFYADGYGNGWSSRLPYKENPGLSEAQVNQRMEDYVGITRYVTNELDYDIEHIDTFGKILAPDRLVWGAFPQDTTPWIYAEAALKRIQQLQSPYGWPYKIERMPLFSAGGSWTAYINSLQTGKKIVMPKYNTGNDNTAKAIFETAAPGYQVAMVANGGTYWGDSVHCRSRNFMRGDAIRIYPQPHWEATDDELNPYPVTAEVIPDNSTSLQGNPTVYWSLTGGAPFQQTTMNPTGNPNEYTGLIPAAVHGSTISYYLHAQDQAGRTKDCPLVAPDGLFTIEVYQDLTPPDLQHDVIHGATTADWPCEVSCVALDDTGIPAVTLESRINGVPQAPIGLVREEGTFRFSCDMSGSAGLGDLVSYRLLATDGASPANVATSPGEGWNYFTIDPRNQILVIELDESHDSGARLVEVADDLGQNVQYTNSWPASPSDWDVLMICLGMNPTQANLTTAQANALTSFLSGGGAAYLEGGNAWAQSSTSSVYRSWFGISSASSGANLTANVMGVAGQVTDGMSFVYSGEKSSADHLTPQGAADAILRAGGYNKAVSYATGTYETVAASFQLGGLVEGSNPSHSKYLSALYLDHLGLDIDLVVHRTPGSDKAQVDLKGHPLGLYKLFLSTAPSHYKRGSLLLEIDRANLSILQSGWLGATGTLSQEIQLPPNPGPGNVEVYFQALVKNPTTGGLSLTNRDRLVIEPY